MDRVRRHNCESRDQHKEAGVRQRRPKAADPTGGYISQKTRCEPNPHHRRARRIGGHV